MKNLFRKKSKSTSNLMQGEVPQDFDVTAADNIVKPAVLEQDNKPRRSQSARNVARSLRNLLPKKQWTPANKSMPIIVLEGSTRTADTTLSHELTESGSLTDSCLTITPPRPSSVLEKVVEFQVVPEDDHLDAGQNKMQDEEDSDSEPEMEEINQDVQKHVVPMPPPVSRFSPVDQASNGIVMDLVDREGQIHTVVDDEDVHRHVEELLMKMENASYQREQDVNAERIDEEGKQDLMVNEEEEEEEVEEVEEVTKEVEEDTEIIEKQVEDFVLGEEREEQAQDEDELDSISNDEEGDIFIHDTVQVEVHSDVEATIIVVKQEEEEEIAEEEEEEEEDQEEIAPDSIDASKVRDSMLLAKEIVVTDSHSSTTWFPILAVVATLALVATLVTFRTQLDFTFVQTDGWEMPAMMDLSGLTSLDVRVMPLLDWNDISALFAKASEHAENMVLPPPSVSSLQDVCKGAYCGFY